MHDFASGQTAPLGVSNAVYPTFSPDGEFLAVVASGWLQRIDLRGGEAVQVIEIGHEEALRGLHWESDGNLYYATGLAGGIWTVSAFGGEARQVTSAERTSEGFSHQSPLLLPDRKTLLYVACCSTRRIYAVDLETGDTAQLVENGFSPLFVPSTDHLLFGRGSSVMAAPFDPTTGAVGQEIAFIDGLAAAIDWSAHLSVSDTGTLAYVEGTPWTEWVLRRIDSAGNVTVLDATPRAYLVRLKLSPTADRLAFDHFDGRQQDVYVLDVEDLSVDRITEHPSNDFGPVWTPDGRALTFTSLRDGAFDLWTRPFDLSGPSMLLIHTEDQKWADSWTPDGETLLYLEGVRTDLKAWQLGASDSGDLLLTTNTWNVTQTSAVHGDWLAYTSREQGQDNQVYVRPFLGGGRCRVSIDGGSDPKWSSDGRRLYFRHHEAAMMATIDTETGCATGVEQLFDGLSPLWDVTSDGSLFVTAGPSEPARLRIVQNWHQELIERVPIP